MDVFVTILIAVTVIAIAAMLFLGWTAVQIVRLVLGAFFGRRQVHAPPAIVVPTGDRAPTGWGRCPNDKCRHPNPVEAIFCRRCGMNLVAAKINKAHHEHRQLARA